jgi:hypothetical protein
MLKIILLSFFLSLIVIEAATSPLELTNNSPAAQRIKRQLLKPTIDGKWFESLKKPVPVRSLERLGRDVASILARVDTFITRQATRHNDTLRSNTHYIGAYVTEVFDSVVSILNKTSRTNSTDVKATRLRRFARSVISRLSDLSNQVRAKQTSVDFQTFVVFIHQQIKATIEHVRQLLLQN